MNTYDTRKSVTSLIATNVQNPAEWLLAVRRFAEALRFDVTRCILVGTTSLDLQVAEVLNEAKKQGRTMANVTEAMRAI